MKLAAVLLQATLLLSVSMAATLQTATMRSTPIAVGELAPDFTLDDQTGHKTTLSDARGKSPVVLIFYRGYW